MSDLTMFSYEGAELRTLTIDGEPWFSAPDACQMLGLRDTTSALKMVDNDDKQRLRRSDTPHFFGAFAPQVQSFSIVNESGMYALIFQSRKAQARKVKRWVTREVLPQIRKRGGYLTPEAVEQTLTDPDFIIRLATDLKEERARRAEVEEHARRIEPAARSWETMAAAGGDYSVAEAAKVLSRDPAIRIGRNRLFAFMHQLGWLFRTRGHRAHWEASQHKALDTGRLVHKISRPFLNERTGEMETPPPTVRITHKGLHELHKHLGGSADIKAVTA